MSDKGVQQVSSGAILVPSWQRARDQSCSALLAGDMCVVVTGLPGTGKTMLIDTVARALRSTGWTVVALTAQLPPDVQFAALTGSAAILIDDADRLTPIELRTLNRLRQCSVLLAGAVGLEKRCPADSRVTLAPLPFEEVGTFVGLWLERTGLDPDLITEAAVAHLADVSGCIPRALGMLLADSLKGARAGGSDRIEDHHIDHAAWLQVESTAARRLHGVTSTLKTKGARPASANPASAKPDFALEHRLSQAPFADLESTETRSSLMSSQALRVAIFGVAIGLVMVAGLLTRPHWSRWAVTTYGMFAPATDAPRQAAPPVIVETSPPPVLAPMPFVATSPEPVAPPVAPQTPTLAPAVTVSSKPSLSSDAIALLIQHGQQMIDLNDYSTARLLFGRAAEAGSVTAMLALGRSYDPSFGRLAPAAGLDPAQAAQWYRKAAALGDADAASLLQQLEQPARE